MTKPITTLAVIQPAAVLTCRAGCGECCKNLWLEYGPGRLEELYSSENSEEIRLIFPMLEGRCLGKVPKGTKFCGFELDSPRYVYGPCRNLTEEGLCGIHETRPKMCRDYPRYDFQEGKNQARNPAEYRRCGYNEDPDYGITGAEMLAAMVPLDEWDTAVHQEVLKHAVEGLDGNG